MSIPFTAPKMTFPDGKELLIDTFSRIVFYEAIDHPFMHGYITVTDPSVLSRMVVGGETLEFKFESSFEDGKFEKTFTVYGKTNEPVSERGVRALRILFLSDEGLKAASKRLNKAWDKPISKIVEDIFDNLPLSPQPQGTKKLDVDDTNVNFKYIAPNISAEDVLDILLSMCFDSDGYPYVLYENMDGINFKSFKKLLDQYQSDDLFVYSNALQALSSIPTSQRAIIIERLQVFRSFDLRSLLRRGCFKTQIVGFDFLNKEDIDVPYDIESRSPYDGSLSHEQYDTETVATYKEDDHGPHLFVPISEDSFMTDFAHNVAFKRAVGNLSSSIKVQFEQQNSPYFHTVGDCINLSFDNQVVRVGTNNQGTDIGTKLSGRYLLTKVTHKFRVESGLQYDKDVEAIKLGYGDTV